MSLKQKHDDFLLDHPIIKTILSYFWTILGSAFAAFCIAYCFRTFVEPETSTEHYNLIAGGVNGVNQVITLALVKMGVIKADDTETIKLIHSIMYLVINTPLFIFAFFKIGKRFSILTLINVLLTSLFLKYIPQNWYDLFTITDDMLARAIFAGILNGFGIALALELNHCTGGTDVVSMYFGLKKGIAIGKYVLIINSIIVLIFILLSSVDTPNSPAIKGPFTMGLYTILFFFVSSLVIDQISSRNKKVQLQIVTSEPRLAKVLIANFPHGCTVLDGKGAYLEQDKKVILTVISAFELKQATKIIYKIDPNAFITVSNPYKVFGKFFIKPMK